MSSKKPLTKLKQNGLQRRLTVALAGAGSGARLLGNHASSFFKHADEKTAIRSAALADEANKFAAKLGELKGAYVKIGQMMAMYGDHLLPPEVNQALHNLENQTQAMDWAVIEPELIKELGTTYAEDLKFSKQAVAAASLSQVHRATRIHDQQDLCVKVQYPGVADTIVGDFQAVLQMMRLARWLPTGQDFEAWLQEIKGMLLDEVDYLREANMAARVASLVAHDARYKVPKCYQSLSTGTVLTMDYAPGYAVTDPRVQRLSKARRNALALAMLDNFFAEVFEWGLMQTDPNFGNYLVQLRDQSNQSDKLVLLDFGAVRDLPKEFSRALQKTILAAHQQDEKAVINGAIELGCLQRSQTSSVKKSFAAFCILLMEPFKEDHSLTPSFALNKQGEYNWHESKLLKRVGKAGAKAVLTEGFSSPPKEFALIARKLSGVFSFISALKAEFNAAPVINKYLGGG